MWNRKRSEQPIKILQGVSLRYALKNQSADTSSMIILAISRHFASGLWNIYRYIANEPCVPDTAAKQSRRILQSIKELSKMPRSAERCARFFRDLPV